MNEKERAEQVAFIKSGLSHLTKPQIKETLEEKGVKVSGRERKDDLLGLMADLLIDEESEKLAPEEKKEKNGADAHKADKSPGKGEKRANTTASGRKKTPELTKARRKAVRELR